MPKIIAFEGIDGSGKGTQSKLLANFCRRAGIRHKLFSFPRYRDTFFGKEVGRYLNGEYGDLNTLDPRMAALLYAGDRYESLELLHRAIASTELIICDRYTPSNLAHQGAKAKTRAERRRILAWIETLEYEVFKIPRPDRVIFLDIDTAQSSKLVALKGKRSYTRKKKDLHEANATYMSAVSSVYQELARDRTWRRIACCDAAGRIRPPADIAREVRSHVGLT